MDQDVSVEENIKYAVPERCMLDVYINKHKKGKSVARVIIVLHGGAWTMGNKSSARDMCQSFIKDSTEYVAVAPSYRLSTVSDENVKSLLFLEALLTIMLALLSEGNIRALLIVMMLFMTLTIVTYVLSKPRDIIHHPVHAKDVADVVRWVHDNIHTFGGDPNQIFIVGHSAGGHLASIVSCNPDFLHGVGLPQSTIKGTVCLSGVFSDKRMVETSIGREIMRNAFGHKSSYIGAFPIYHAQPSTPPHFLINANFDYSLIRHTHDFFYALRAHDVYVKTKVYEKTDHFSIRLDWGSTNKQVLHDILQFIDDVAHKT